MNILLIFPLNEAYEVIVTANATAWSSKLNVHKNIKKLDCAYPTGLLSIASYVKKIHPAANIRILDVNAVLNLVAQRKCEAGESFDGYGFPDLMDEALAFLGGFVPDLIGTSTLFCSNYRDLGALTDFLRTRYPDALQICGGHLASAVYRRILEEEKTLDAVCFGEGEIPMAELVGAMAAGRTQDYLNGSDCWITPEKHRRRPDFVPQGKVIVDLDEIPPFDLDLLVFPEVYFNSTRYFFVIESSLELREIFMFTTRGCPYHCVFCASQNVHGNKIRKYSTERIKQDILHYHERYGITRFVFYDDHFLVNKRRAIELLDFVSSKQLLAEVPTPAFFSINDDIAAAMQKVGIREVNITIESGNIDTLKNIMHKPSDLAKAEEAVKILHRHGITAVSNILIGLPGETKASIEAGLRYLLTTEINWFQCFVAAPLPGSELYDICEQNGYFVPGYDLSTMDYKRCLIKTADFTPEYIEKMAYEMNLTLNFVNNYDYRCGNYAAALKMFERIITTVIDTHAFAYYFAAKCCAKLDLTEQYMVHKGKYEEMLSRYEFWRVWADYFHLTALPAAATDIANPPRNA